MDFGLAALKFTYSGVGGIHLFTMFVLIFIILTRDGATYPAASK